MTRGDWIARSRSGITSRRLSLHIKTTPIYILRHGQTPSNLRRRYAGRGVESLTAVGCRESDRAAQYLRGAGIAAVWTSGIARARETATILSSALEIPLRDESRLDEMLLGPWEGLTEDEVAQQYPCEFKVWNERPDLLRLPGRETLEELASRVAPVLNDAASQTKPVLLVTHVAIIRVLTLSVLGHALSGYKRLAVPNVSCMRIDVETREVVHIPSLEPVVMELGSNRESNPAGVRHPC